MQAELADALSQILKDLNEIKCDIRAIRNSNSTEGKAYKKDKPLKTDGKNSEEQY